jgi:hypothetical protein
MASISDLISFAVNKQPIDFGSTVSEILGDKATEALDLIKQSLQQNLCYDTPNEEVE